MHALDRGRVDVRRHRARGRPEQQSVAVDVVVVDREDGRRLPAERRGARGRRRRGERLRGALRPGVHEHRGRVGVDGVAGRVERAHGVVRGLLVGRGRVGVGERAGARVRHGADDRPGGARARAAAHLVVVDADRVVRRRPAQRRAARDRGRRGEHGRGVRSRVVDGDRGDRRHELVAGAIDDHCAQVVGAVTDCRRGRVEVAAVAVRRVRDGTAVGVGPAPGTRRGALPLHARDAGGRVRRVRRQVHRVLRGAPAHDSARGGRQDGAERVGVVDDDGARGGERVQRVVDDDVADVIGAVGRGSRVPGADGGARRAGADGADEQCGREDTGAGVVLRARDRHPAGDEVGRARDGRDGDGARSARSVSTVTVTPAAAPPREDRRSGCSNKTPVARRVAGGARRCRRTAGGGTAAWPAMGGAGHAPAARKTCSVSRGIGVHENVTGLANWHSPGHARRGGICSRGQKRRDSRSDGHEERTSCHAWNPPILAATCTAVCRAVATVPREPDVSGAQAVPNPPKTTCSGGTPGGSGHPANVKLFLPISLP